VTPSAEERHLAAILIRREREAPLAYCDLWHSDQTSQREALRPLSDPGILALLCQGGNGAGKSDLLAMWAVASAAGRDAWIKRGSRRFYWVREWLDRNDLPPEIITHRDPQTIWVGSETYGAARQQIRPKLAAYAPPGSDLLAWDSDREGRLALPGGGLVLSRAYQQYRRHPQSWEGAEIGGAAFDEEPPPELYSVALQRMRRRGGRVVNALTPLTGTGGAFYRSLIEERIRPEWLAISQIWGEDNPHIDQTFRRAAVATAPPSLRVSRDRGEWSAPAGQIFALGDAHDLAPGWAPPAGWIRWVGIDWGGRSPHVVWIAEDPAGILYAYRELAPRREAREPAISDRWLIEEARRLESGDPSARRVYRVADSESPGAITDAAACGWHLDPARKGPGSIAEGIGLLELLLETRDAETGEERPPYLRISRSACAVLWSELSGLVWSAGGLVPDPACPDHGPDAIRYVALLRRAEGYAIGAPWGARRAMSLIRPAGFSIGGYR